MRFGRNPGRGEHRRNSSGNPASLVKGELQTGEKLLWAAKPSGIRSHVLGKLPLALFGIPFFAFAVFWTNMAAEMGGGGFDLFPLFGVPFMLIGAGLILSPIYAAWLADRTVYALTDRRLIIIKDGWQKSVRSWTLAQADELERRDHSDGTSSLYFATSISRDTKGRSTTRRHGFVGIDGAADLEYQITRLRDSLPDPS